MLYENREKVHFRFFSEDEKILLNEVGGYGNIVDWKDFYLLHPPGLDVQGFKWMEGEVKM